MSGKARTDGVRTNLNAILYKSTQWLPTKRTLTASFFIFLNIKNSWPERQDGFQYPPDDVQCYVAGRRAEIAGSSGTKGLGENQSDENAVVRSLHATPERERESPGVKTAAGRVHADRCRSADPTIIQYEPKQTIETQSRAQPGCEPKSCEALNALSLRVARRDRYRI